MRQGCQELVLGAIGLLRFAVEPGVLQREADPSRKLLRKDQFRRSITIGFGRDKTDNSKYSVAARDRHNHGGSKTQLLQSLELMLVSNSLAQFYLLGEKFLRRVRMRNQRRADFFAVQGQIDEAPLRKCWNGEP